MRRTALPSIVISRRKLLAGTSAAAALVVLPGCQPDRDAVIDVRKFGATGDGATDDSRAIQSATAELRSGGTLYFPTGIYRFAQRDPTGSAAIVITGVTNVTVDFEPGAELFMDNLDPTTRNGTSHGLLIQGPVSRILLSRVNIRWATGAQRSLGDGIRIVGWPGSGAAVGLGRSLPRGYVERVTLSDCTIRSSPQTGAVMLGVSDIAVNGLKVTDSGADGLHFNACRRARIVGLQAANTGDDGLALVTYFAQQFAVDEASHTFSFPHLTDWSNADFDIRNVVVVDGRANGVRIAGAQRISVRGLTVDGVRSGSAVMVDSAEPGAEVGWDYVASHAVRVHDVAASNCETGIHLLARPGSSGDQRFTNFDVQVDDAKLDDCSNWSVRAESLTDRKASGLRITDCSVSATSRTGGNGGVGITNAEGISLGNMSIRHAEPVVTFSAVNARQLAVDRLSVTIDKSEQPSGAAAPCVSLDRSDGVINELELDWPAAPASWIALKRFTDGQCRDAPVAIRNFKLVPPLTDSAISCP